jgi:hypothetical protein
MSLEDGLLFGVTKIQAMWLPSLGSKVLLTQKGRQGPATYDAAKDEVCGVIETTFDMKNWQLPKVAVTHAEPWRAFAVALLTGLVASAPGMRRLGGRFSERPERLVEPAGPLLPERREISAVLRRGDVASGKALADKWRNNAEFLRKEVRAWVRDWNSDDELSWPPTSPWVGHR